MVLKGSCAELGEMPVDSIDSTTILQHHELRPTPTSWEPFAAVSEEDDPFFRTADAGRLDIPMPDAATETYIEIDGAIHAAREEQQASELAKGILQY